MDPLFPDEPAENQTEQERKTLTHTDNAAVQMLRHKIDAMFQQEPDARQEARVAEQAHGHRSKHQAFMHQLTASGKSMAEIQAAWHDYYAGLSDREKHEVWQEFYRANAANRATAHQQPQPVHDETRGAQPRQPDLYTPTVSIHAPAGPVPVAAATKHRSLRSIKENVLNSVHNRAAAQTKAKQHLQSLAFGIGMGALALLIALFGLFNEMVITPFIRPGSAAAAPIILNTDGPAPSSTPEVIIPKINAQLPVDYETQSLAESDIQKSLENGVYHYATTAVPGQNGNVAIFGHSSNNILNKGKYKFAFVLLHELQPGDIFYLTHDNKVYSYRVFTKKVVTPEETWVLTSTEGKTATAALITCDPPGSTRHRLVVWGEQITPDPNTNAAAAEPAAELQTQHLPGKAENWLTRLNPFD